MFELWHRNLQINEARILPVRERMVIERVVSSVWVLATISHSEYTQNQLPCCHGSRYSRIDKKITTITLSSKGGSCIHLCICLSEDNTCLLRDIWHQFTKTSWSPAVRRGSPSFLQPMLCRPLIFPGCHRAKYGKDIYLQIYYKNDF